jgi:GntR family carbon starvation induced transcriptional regulator
MDSEKALTKSEQAYATLRREILDTKLKPLSPLRLEAIRETYGIGWTPLREALTRLEAEHLVVSTANKGFAVAPVSMAELRDLTKSKRVIEAQLFGESIDAGDANWEAGVVAAHYMFSRCPSPLGETIGVKEMTEWGERHDAFHMALIAANDSPWLTRYYHQLTDHMRRHGRALRLALSPDIFHFARNNKTAEYKALQKAYSLASHTTLMTAALERRKADAVDLLLEHNDLTRRAYDALETTGLTIATDLNAADASQST